MNTLPQDEVKNTIEDAYVFAMDNEMCNFLGDRAAAELRAVDNIVAAADIYADDYGIDAAEFLAYAKKQAVR